MLEQINMEKKADWVDYESEMAHLEIRMGQLQRECREMGIPIMILLRDLRHRGRER
jgi:hypothetical protein